MIGEFGEVLVMDWGVAQHGDTGGDDAVLGTRGCMAPEQAAGGAADARSDIHALGVLLAWLCEGHAVDAHPETVLDTLGRFARTYRGAILLVLAYILMRAIVVYVQRP